MNRKPLLIGVGIVLVLVVAVVVYFVIQSSSTPTDETLIPVSSDEVMLLCPLDTQLCSDGSFVKKDPLNNCEFYDCPVDENATESEADSTVCTLEVKTCPDGEEVGRESSRSCQFKLCSDGTQLQ